MSWLLVIKLPHLKSSVEVITVVEYKLVLWHLKHPLSLFKYI